MCFWIHDVGEKNSLRPDTAFQLKKLSGFFLLRYICDKPNI